MFWRAGFTPPPELALLSMPVRPAGYRHGPAGRPSGGNAASELRLLRRRAEPRFARLRRAFQDRNALRRNHFENIGFAKSVRDPPFFA